MVAGDNNGRVDMHTDWLSRIEGKVDTILVKHAETYRIIGQHEVKLCQNGEDIKSITTKVHRVAIGVGLIIIAAVVGVYIGR